MRLAAIRFVIGGAFISLVRTDGILSYIPWLTSILLGAGMAYFGYRCCHKVYDQSLAFIGAAFLFVPGGWALALLIINGNIGDALYKCCGSVGFFGATDEQIEKLARKPTETG